MEGLLVDFSKQIQSYPINMDLKIIQFNCPIFFTKLYWFLFMR